MLFRSAVLVVTSFLGVASLLLGLKFTHRSYIAMFGKLALYAVLIIGMVTLLAVSLLDENVRLPELRYFEIIDLVNMLSELWIFLYGFSFMGFLMFIFKVYAKVELEVNAYLIKFGDMILEVGA